MWEYTCHFEILIVEKPITIKLPASFKPLPGLFQFDPPFTTASHTASASVQFSLSSGGGGI